MIEGQQITPTLRLSRLLGQGAMGSVWIADHLALGTQVAVKFMSPAVAQNEALVQRFRREAVAAAQIKSPHIAQVFDHGVTSEGVPYIIMELLEGEDLDARIRRTGPMSPQEAANVIRQVARALTRAHQVGVIHRDIKPSNIFLVDLDGELLVKVLDFGVAKIGADPNLSMTSTGTVFGTPLYMSPEQLFSAKHTDARSDLWSLGVVAYFTMTGRLPFCAETLAALSVLIHSGVYPPPSSVRPGIRPAIDTWFEKALRLDPNARFATAREMADALLRAVGLTGNVSLPEIVSSDAPPATPAAGPPSSASLLAVGDSSAGVQTNQNGQAGRTLSGIVNTRSSIPSRRALLVLVVTLLGAAAVAGVFLVISRQRSAEPQKLDAESAAPAAPSSAPVSSVTTTVPVVTPEIMTATTTTTPSASALPGGTVGAAPKVAAAPLVSTGQVTSGTAAVPTRGLVAPKSSSAASNSKPVKDTIGF